MDALGLSEEFREKEPWQMAVIPLHLSEIGSGSLPRAGIKV
jgi:hypothetical protein